MIVSKQGSIPHDVMINIAKNWRRWALLEENYTLKGSRTVRRVLFEDEAIESDFLVPKKKKLDGHQVRLMRCVILSLLLLVFCFSFISGLDALHTVFHKMQVNTLPTE